MFGKLLAVFILVPLIEFTLLVQVAAETGFLMTFFLVVATGALGSHLARREGLETWRRFHETVQKTIRANRSSYNLSASTSNASFMEKRDFAPRFETSKYSTS